MSNQKIAILGGTGYTGQNLAREATRRGLAVTAVSRTAPKDALPGVAYVRGSVTDDALLTKLAAEHDVVVVAMRAADGVLSEHLPALAKAVIAGKSRWGHVNGAGSALVAPGGLRLIDTPEFPSAYKAEAAPCASVFDWLRDEAPAELNWVAITPAAGYGSSNPGQALGHYRKGAICSWSVMKASRTSQVPTLRLPLSTRSLHRRCIAREPRLATEHSRVARRGGWCIPENSGLRDRQCLFRVDAGARIVMAPGVLVYIEGSLRGDRSRS